MVNTLTNKTIMAPMDGIKLDGPFAEDIEDLRRAQDSYAEAKRAKEEQKDRIIKRLNTLEYDATCLRARVNDLEKKNTELTVTNKTIMKELEIKNPVFEKELRQKVSKMIKNLKNG